MKLRKRLVSVTLGGIVEWLVFLKLVSVRRLQPPYLSLLLYTTMLLMYHLHTNFLQQQTLEGHSRCPHSMCNCHKGWHASSLVSQELELYMRTSEASLCAVFGLQKHTFKTITVEFMCLAIETCSMASTAIPAHFPTHETGILFII